MNYPSLFVGCMMVALVSFFIYTEYHARKSLKSVIDWCDTSDAFFYWKTTNPSVYIGLSDEGKRLLRDLILAWDRFVTMHPYCRNDKYREHLMSLFDDLPPRPYRPWPKTRLPDSRAVFIFDKTIRILVV